MASSVVTAAKTGIRLIDVGANLTDPVFRGVYRGRSVHPDDFDEMLKRAYKVGVEKIMVTGGCLEDCKRAVDLVKDHDTIFTTVGCHPTRCSEFESTKNTTPQEYMEQLSHLISNNLTKVVALGEFGLDYDRLQFCGKELQKKYFEKQFELCEVRRLPLFLHCRNAFDDFFDILHRNRTKFDHGVVHSFTGNYSEAKRILEFGLNIGINGCSMKTAENLEVIKLIPPDRIMIETGDICCILPRMKQASPHMHRQVLEVLSSLYGKDIVELSRIIYQNTCSVFNF